MFFEGYTEKLWGRHPRDISADWGEQRVKGLSIIAILKDIFRKKGGKNNDKNGKNVETSLIEEFYYPKYGPGQLWETAAEEFEKMGGRIEFGCKVTNIYTENGAAKTVSYIKKDNSKQDNSKAAANYEEQKAETLDADIVISSMPLKELILGMNDVPENVRDIAAGLPYRDFVTVGLLVDKLNLKNETKLKTLNNIVPDCWIYVQDTGVKLGRIQVFNNWSPYLVNEPDKKVWIGLEYFCSEGDKYWRLSEKKWVYLATKELIKMGVISSEKDVLDSHREKIKKAYPAYFDTYKDIDKIIAYLD